MRTTSITRLSIGRPGRRLGIVRCLDSTDIIAGAFGDGLSRTADVCPINIGAEILNLHLSSGGLLDFDSQRLTTAPLLIRDLPEVRDGRATLFSELRTLLLGQSLEVNVKGIHGETIANALVNSKHLLAETRDIAITANASFKV